ncbi:MAG: DNA topoisomerase VI subunit B, partial [Candidatus Heimdallarchaeaceae archaeon]
MAEENKTRKMSAAAFFNENKAIAGFGNSMRAVFTSVRELVENGLDAAEKLGVNPEIYIELRKLSSSEINELLDITRYKQLEKHLDFLQLTCRDNGVGVPGHEIPNLFGRVLTGTKYGVIQTRGRFGLGAKMCLLHSMSSVDLPARIKSRYFMEEMTTEVHLMINLEKNEPVIMEQHEYNPDDPGYLHTSGTEISITFTGAWNLAKNSIKEYFKQLAIITPYASFTVVLPGDEEGTSETLVFQKVVDDMPDPPTVIQLHRFGCDITQFKAKIAATSAENLVDFLSKDFMGVRKEVAEEFFQILEIDPNKKPSDLTSKEIRRIVHEGFIKAYQEAKEIKRKRDRIFRFDAPQGDALSPLGAARLRKGLEKELEPEFVEAISRPPKAYSGHPFIVEAAIGYGGGVSKYAQQKGSTSVDNKIIYRYANRIPLIFGAGNDVITKVVSSLNWSEYGLTRQSDPLAIAVSIVSTKIPFPETSKEYISTVPEIEEEIRLALQQLGRRLKTFLSRAKRRKREHARLSRFVRSAPVVIDNLARILENEKIVYTNINKEKYKVAAALAHGAKKKIRNFVPLGTPIFELNVWCPDKYKKSCVKSDILTIGKFLSIPVSELAPILNLSKKEVSRIKQRTIYELDRSKLSPELPLKALTNKMIDKRFARQGTSSSFNEALYQRWIQNSYHYLATEATQLRLVEGLVERLIEDNKFKLINEVTKSQDGQETVELSSFIQEFKFNLETMSDYSELKEEFLYPDFNYIKTSYPNFSNKFKGLEDFIYKFNEPFSFKYDNDLTEMLIDYVKKVFSHVSEKFPDFLKVNITKMKPDWIDGYSKNAFHRRKIETIDNFLKTPTKDLLEIKELERSIYTRFFTILANSERSIPLNKLGLISNIDDNIRKNILDSLKSVNIETLAQYANAKLRTLMKKELSVFVDSLLEESKFRILSHLNEVNKDLDLSHLKVISEKAEEKLLENKIFTSTSFLITPSKKLREMGLLKSEIARIKKKIGTPIPNFLFLKNKASKYEIYTVEDILYSQPENFEFEDEQTKKQYVSDYLLLRTPLIFAFPELNEKINVLNEIGVNCIGRFLIWSNKELSLVLNLNEQEIIRLKQSISANKITKNKERYKGNLKIIKKHFPRLVKQFNEQQTTIQELFYFYIEEELPSISDLLTKMNNFREFMNEDLIFLAKLAPTKSKAKSLNDALLKLKTKDVNTIRDFLQLTPVFIETEISKNKDKKVLLELYDNINSKNLKDTDEFAEKVLLSHEIIDFYQFLQLPITRIKSLKLKDYEVLASKKIYSLHQFLNYSFDELSTILNFSKKNFDELINNFDVNRDGQPFYEKVSSGKYESTISFDFENSERFSPEEIRSLLVIGYNSIDQLFYLTHPYTFGATIIKWGVIEKFKKLLRSPLTLVTWEKTTKKKILNEETKQEEEIEEIEITSLSHEQLNALRKTGIRRIIDFFLVSDETIASILKIDLEEAKKYKKNIRISETGTDISELDIFRPSIVEILETNNIFTIEDLYFSTQQEKWAIRTISWEIVQNLKNVLNLRFKHLSDMLDPEIIKLLKKNKINTLLGFLLTSSKVLMERTGIPDERFDNIKRSLDLGEIFYFFSLPVYFLPNLSFSQTEELRKAGILTIVDFVSTSSVKLSNILNITTKETKEIIDILTSQRIREEYEERAIYAYETRLFDKNEQRTLSRETIYSYEGFQSIQELFYCPDEVFIDRNSSIWRKVFTLKKILSLPLRIFQEISDYSLTIFNQNQITHLYHLIFILDSDLTDRTLFRTVSDYSSKLIDLRAYHYFDFLSATAYNKDFFSTILEDIEELTLLDVISSTDLIKTLSEFERQLAFEKCNITLIRSVFELPLGITPFLNLLSEDMRNKYFTITLGSLFELEFEENSPLLQIKNKLGEENSLDKLIGDLSIPISSLNLDVNLALPLSRSSITTLIDFYSTPTKKLSEISNETQKRINEIKENLSYSEIVELHKARSHPIMPSSLITETEISKLRDIGISDIETLYYAGVRMGASSILKQEKYREFKEILSGSITFLSFLSFEEIKKLELQDIHSVIDLSLFEKGQLSQILNNPIYDEFHIFDLLSLDELKEKRLRFAIPLENCPSITSEYVEKLHELGIYSIQDFISRMSEIRKSYPYLVNMNVFKEAKLYLSSVFFLDLELEQMLKLVYSGVGDILTFLTEDITTISLILDIPETEIIKIKENISVKKILNEVEEKGVKLESLALLSKRNLLSLQKLNKDTVQDLYSLCYQIKSFSEEFKENTDNFLSLCNSSVFRISNLSRFIKRSLAKNRILRVIDLFIVREKDLKKIFNSIPEELKDKRKGNISLSSGIPILEEDKELISTLTDFKFNLSKASFEDIFGLVPEYLLIFSESEKIEKASSIAKLEELIYGLCLNIFSISDMSLDVKLDLWKNGVKNIIELLTLSSEEKRTIPSNARSEIIRFVKEFSKEKLVNLIPKDHLDILSSKSDKLDIKTSPDVINLLDLLPQPFVISSQILFSNSNSLTSMVKYPIIWLDKFSQIDQLEFLRNLMKEDKKLILDLLLLPPDNIDIELAEYVVSSLSDFQIPKWAIKLRDVKFLSKQQKLYLKKINIEYLDQLLCLQDYSSEDKNLSSIKKTLSLFGTTPISFLSSLSLQQNSILFENKINTILEFLSIPSVSLGKLFEIEYKEINTIKLQISKRNIVSELKLYGIDLNLLPSLTEKELTKEGKLPLIKKREAKEGTSPKTIKKPEVSTIEYLNENEIYSLIQLFYHDVDQLEINKDEKEKLIVNIPILFTPIKTIERILGISTKNINESLKNKKTYYDYLHIPIHLWETLLPKLDKAIKENNSLFIRNLSSLQFSTLDIANLKLNKSLVQKLYSLGVFSIEYLYYFPEEFFLSLPDSYIEEIKDIRMKLSRNINNLPILTLDTIKSCYNKKLVYIIDVISSIQNLDDAMVDEILSSLSMLKNLHLESFIPPLGSYEEKAMKLGYLSYQELLGDVNLKDKSIFVEISPYLLANIRYLRLEEKIETNLKKGGTYTIVDLLLIPYKTVAKESRIKLDQILKLRSSIKIDKIKKTIEKNKPNHFVDLPFLSEKEKSTLLSYGFYSFSDLEENSIYNWLYDIKKIEKIRTKIKQILDTSILFLSSINSLKFEEIETKYFDNNLFTIRDLVKNDQLVSFGDYNTIISNLIKDKKKTLSLTLKTKDFLGTINSKNLFSKNIEIPEISNIIDFISVLYMNKQFLTKTGLEILNLLNSSVSIITDFTEKEVEKLNEHKIETLKDLLIKPISYSSFLSEKQLEKVNHILSTLNVKTIKKLRDKRVQLSNIILFDSETKKELLKYYTVIDDLVYDLSKKHCKLRSKLRNNVQKILNKSIYLISFPQLPLENWLKLLYKVSTLQEMLLLSKPALAKIISTNISEVDTFLSKITISRISNPPALKTNIVLQDFDIAELRENGIKNYLDLFENTDVVSNLSPSLRTKIGLLQKLSSRYFDEKLPNLSFQQLVFFNIHHDSLKVNSQVSKRLLDIYSFIFSKPTKFEEKLNLPEKDELKVQYTLESLLLLEKYDKKQFDKITSSFPETITLHFNEYLQFLNRHVILLINESFENKKKFKQYGNLTIGDLILKPRYQLSQIIDDNRLIRQIRNLSLETLRTLASKLTPIPETILDKTELDVLSQGHIFSIEEAYVLNIISKSKTSKRWKITEKLRLRIEQKIYSLPLVFESKETFRLLLKSNTKTVYDLLLLNKSSNITVIKNLLSQIPFHDLDSLASQSKSKLIEFVNDKEIINELNENDINSLGELIALFEEKNISDLSMKVKDVLSCFRASLALFIRQKNILSQLAKRGYEQVYDLFFLQNIDDLHIKFTEKQRAEFTELLNSLNMTKVKEQLELNSYRIKDLGLFSDTEKSILENSGYSHIIHLSVSDKRIKEQTELSIRQISTLKELLSYPIYSFYALMQDKPNSIFKLYHKQKYSLWDVFNTKINELTEITNITERQLRNYFATLTPQSLKIAKKGKTQIVKSTPFMSSEIISKLKEIGISSFEELIFADNRVKRKDIFKNKNVQKLLKLIEEPIEKLDVKQQIRNKLNSLGINTIGEFIAYPTSQLEGKLEMTYNDIKKIKQTIPFVKTTTTKAKRPSTTTKKTTTAKTKKPSTTTKKTTTAKTKKPSTTTKKTTTAKTKKASTTTKKTTTTKTKKPSTTTKKTTTTKTKKPSTTTRKT